MPTVEYKYPFGTAVRSTIDPHFKGHISGISIHPGGHAYTVSYFKNDEPSVANFWDFEICLDEPAGFLKNQQQRRNLS